MSCIQVCSGGRDDKAECGYHAKDTVYTEQVRHRSSELASRRAVENYSELIKMGALGRQYQATGFLRVASSLVVRRRRWRQRDQLVNRDKRVGHACQIFFGILRAGKLHNKRKVYFCRMESSRVDDDPRTLGHSCGVSIG